jgi:hypothetical protein
VFVYTIIIPRFMISFVYKRATRYNSRVDSFSFGVSADFISGWRGRGHRLSRRHRFNGGEYIIIIHPDNVETIWFFFPQWSDNRGALARVGGLTTSRRLRASSLFKRTSIWIVAVLPELLFPCNDKDMFSFLSFARVLMDPSPQRVPRYVYMPLSLVSSFIYWQFSIVIILQLSNTKWNVLTPTANLVTPVIFKRTILLYTYNRD